MCVYLSAHLYRMFMYIAYMKVPWRIEERVGSPGTGIEGGCEPTCECWASKMGPLLGQ